ncbi:MAG TPA: hydrogenase small subunit [Nitrospiria bacterium]|nr:hydrogenase small subunit [Nitrospiria bacterium]
MQDKIGPSMELPVIQGSGPPLIAGMSHQKGVRLPVIQEPGVRTDEPSVIPGVSRRDFLKVCGTAAALLGLEAMWVPKIAEALVAAMGQRPSVIWLNFASDTGCTEALIKANYPNAAQLILETLSMDFNETIMAAAGTQAEEILQQALKKGGYILIIEGAVPTKRGYGMVARRDMIDIGREFAEKAKAIIAVGSCATWGGVPSGNPNPAGLKGVREALGVDCINLDLCPVNEGILVATITDYLLNNRLPELDDHGRPKIFYGQTIHDQCERRAHFDAGRFVERFGSKEEELGYCLYKVGCKGPETYANCSKMRYNDRVSWCIGAGAPCIGCAEPHWVDKFAGFYERLPEVWIPGIGGVEAGADKIGLLAGAATAVGIAAHAIGTAAKGRFKGEASEEHKDESKKK